MSADFVFCFGSRAAAGRAWAGCFAWGAALAQAGFGVSVGCAPGADAAFVRGVLSVPGAASRLRVFAVGGPSGFGFPVPAVSLPVLRAAVAEGASVVWWAGGRGGPLRCRLAARSAACLSVSPVAAVGWLASPSSPGSLGSLRRCVAAGVPVFVRCAFAPGLLPRFGRGSWVQASFAGVACWSWVAG